MTVQERSAIAVLTDHVLELKEDMGEVKADVRALKEAKVERRSSLLSLRTFVVAVACACIGATPSAAHTFFGLGK